jgi:hypothetical protein
LLTPVPAMPASLEVVVGTTAQSAASNMAVRLELIVTMRRRRYGNKYSGIASPLGDENGRGTERQRTRWKGRKKEKEEEKIQRNKRKKEDQEARLYEGLKSHPFLHCESGSD